MRNPYSYAFDNPPKFSGGTVRCPFTSRFVSEHEYREVVLPRWKDDRKHALDAARELQMLTLDGTYDGPDTVMLSTGYADVYADGDVVQHGIIVFSVSEDL